MHEGGGFGVNFQLLRDSLKAGLLQAVHKIAQELVCVFLSSLVEVTANGAKILDDGYWLDLTAARAEHSDAVAMELTHRTECLCVT